MLLKNYEIIVFILFALILATINFLMIKKRKKSAKSIYKLIDELEKKYIY